MTIYRHISLGRYATRCDADIRALRFTPRDHAEAMEHLLTTVAGRENEYLAGPALLLDVLAIYR